MASLVRHLLALFVLGASASAVEAAPPALGRADQGALAFRGGDFGRAIEDFTAAIQSHQLTDEQLAATYHHRGVAYHNSGDAGRAALDYSMALSKGLPRDKVHRALNNRGLVYEALGDLDAALNDFTRAIAEQPDYAEAYANRCNTLRKKKDFASAIADCDRAVRLNHARLAQPVMNIGLALEAMGRTRDAVAYYQRALALEPEFADARDRLAALTGRGGGAGGSAQQAMLSAVPASAVKAEDPALVFKGATGPLTVTSSAFGLMSLPPAMASGEITPARTIAAAANTQSAHPVVRRAHAPAPLPAWTGGPAAPIPGAIPAPAPATATPGLRGENDLAGQMAQQPRLDQLVAAPSRPRPEAQPAPTAFTPLSLQPSRPVRMAVAAQTRISSIPDSGPAVLPMPAAPSDGYQLQLGAYETQDQALKGWQAYQESHGAALAGVNPRILEGTGRNNKTVYRLYAIAFAERDAAQSLCRKVMGAKSACLISAI